MNKNRVFTHKQQRRSTDMMTLHSLIRYAYDAWRFQHGADVSVICERIAHHYFAGGLHRENDKPILRETISEAAIANNRTNITRWLSKDTPDARAVVSDLSVAFFGGIPKKLGEEVLNLWLGPAGFIVSAVNEPSCTPNVPDLNAKLGSASKEFGEAIEASLQIPLNESASTDQIRAALAEWIDVQRANQHAIEHLEHMLAERSRPTTGNRRTDKR